MKRERLKVPAALLVALLVAVGVLSAAAVVGAGTPPPDAWTVASTRAGDAGAYSYAIVSSADSGHEGLVPAVPFRTFTVGGTAPMLAHDGETRLRTPWVLRDGGYFRDSTSRPYEWRLGGPTIQHHGSQGLIDATTGAAPLVSPGNVLPAVVPAMSLSNIPDGTQTGNRVTDQDDVRVTDLSIRLPSCLHALRGGDHRTAKLVPFHACDLVAPALAVGIGDPVTELPSPAMTVVARLPEGTLFDAVRMARVEGNETLEATFGPMTVWLDEELPVPRQVAIRDGAVTHVYRLESFAAGDHAIEAPDPAVPARVIPSVPAAFHGPDETGTTHPYPASEAWADADDHPAVADFLGAHPGARVAALHGSFDAADEVWSHGTLRWRILLSDGHEGLMIDVSVPFGEFGAIRHATISTAEAEPRLPPLALPRVAALLDELGAHDLMLWGFGDCDCGAWAIGLDHAWGATPEGQSQHTVQEQGLAIQNETLAAVWTNEHGHTSRVDSWQGQGRQPDSEVAPATLRWTEPKQVAWPATTGAAILAGALAYLALKLPWAGLFSRISKDEVLDHPMRASIVDLIEAEPGIHVSRAARRAGIGHRTLLHHLDKLEDAGLVVRRAAGGYTCLFAQGTDPAMLQAAACVRAPKAKALLEAVLDQPGASLSELAGAAGVTASTAHHHLRRMREAGIVETAKAGRSVRHTATRLGQRLT